MPLYAIIKTVKQVLNLKSFFPALRPRFIFARLMPVSATKNSPPRADILASGRGFCRHPISAAFSAIPMRLGLRRNKKSRTQAVRDLRLSALPKPENFWKSKKLIRRRRRWPARGRIPSLPCKGRFRRRSRAAWPRTRNRSRSFQKGLRPSRCTKRNLCTGSRHKICRLH